MTVVAKTKSGHDAQSMGPYRLLISKKISSMESQMLLFRGVVE